jgi:hypothetical protein
MDKTGDIKQEPQLVFEYNKDPMFRSAYAHGFVGGLTANGHVHIAFFSERAQLPKKQIYTINPDGSIGPQLPDERAMREPIVRDIQMDVLMTVQAAEGLKSWLDSFIKNLRSRAGNLPEGRGLAALSNEIGRVGAA